MMNNDKESCFYSKIRSKHQLTAHNIKTRSEMEKKKKNELQSSSSHSFNSSHNFLCE